MRQREQSCVQSFEINYLKCDCNSLAVLNGTLQDGQAQITEVQEEKEISQVEKDNKKFDHKTDNSTPAL